MEYLTPDNVVMAAGALGILLLASGSAGIRKPLAWIKGKITSQDSKPDDAPLDLVALIAQLESMREAVVDEITELEIKLVRIDKMLGVKR